MECMECMERMQGQGQGVGDAVATVNGDGFVCMQADLVWEG